MKLAVFHLAERKDAKIEINAAQVVAIEPQGEVTRILLALTDNEGKPISYTVAHKSTVVEHRLGAGSNTPMAP